jgi:hypothetical protein
VGKADRGSDILGVEIWAGRAVTGLGALILFCALILFPWLQLRLIVWLAAGAAAAAAAIAIVVGLDPAGVARAAHKPLARYAERGSALYFVPIGTVAVTYGAVRALKALSVVGSAVASLPQS